MKYTTVTEELAAKYPELEGRVGETIEAPELVKIQRAHGDAQTTKEKVDERKADTTNAPAAPSNAPKVSAKKTSAKKTGKRY